MARLNRTSDQTGFVSSSLFEKYKNDINAGRAPYHCRPGISAFVGITSLAFMEFK